jgi:hypothetical protein
MMDWAMFAWGLVGFVIVELAEAYGYYRSAERLPRRYAKYGFWLLFVMVALTAGALSVALHPSSVLDALSVGAAAPLIAGRLRRSPGLDRRS